MLGTACGVVLLLAIGWRWRAAALGPHWLPAGLSLASAALAGFGYAALRADVRLADALPAVWEGQDIVVVGVVDDLPRVVGSRPSLRACASSEVVTPGAHVPRAHLAVVAAGARDAERSVDVPAIRAGERWRSTCACDARTATRTAAGSTSRRGCSSATCARPATCEPGRRTRASTRSRARRSTTCSARARRIRDHALRALDGARHTRRARRARDRRPVGHRRARVDGVQPHRRRSPDQRQRPARHRVRDARRRRCVRRRAALRRADVAHPGAQDRRRGGPRRVVRLRAARRRRGPGAAHARDARRVGARPVDRPARAAAIAVWIWALVAVLAWDPWAVLAPGFWLSFFAVGLLIYVSERRLRFGATAHRRVARRCASCARRRTRNGRSRSDSCRCRSRCSSRCR